MAQSLWGSGDLALEAGGFVFVTPEYEGSKHYKVIGFPVIYPAGADENSWLQVKGVDNVQFRLLQWQGFEIGPVAGYRFDRDEGDGDRLIGLGNIDGGLVLGGYAAYRFGPVRAYVAYNHQVTGDDTGGLVRFGVDGVVRLSPTVKLTLGVGTTYADDDYMRAFFGVTQRQALTSVHNPYTPDAGIKDVNFSATIDVALDPRWNLKLIGQYARLVGDAADSPVIETQDQFVGGVGLTYKFNLAR